jgi:hypothetical protein
MPYLRHPPRRAARLPWQTTIRSCSASTTTTPTGGNEPLGPAASLAGREHRQDFAGKDGWRMYHGEPCPASRSTRTAGFETVTIVRRAHRSLRLARAPPRFGGGDVQWLTPARGIVHAEMFPLLDADGRTRSSCSRSGSTCRRAQDVDPHFHDVLGRGHPASCISSTMAGNRPRSR